MFSTKEFLFDGKNAGELKCPSCGGALRALRKDSYLYLFSMRIFLKGTEDFFECNGCERKFSKTEVAVSSSVVKSYVLPSGSKISVTTTTTEKTIKTVTQANHRNLVPRTKNNRLMATTIAAIMAFLTHINKNLMLRDHEQFKAFCSLFPDYSDDILQTVKHIEDQETSAAKQLVLDHFKTAEKEFTKTSLMFIVKQSLPVIPFEHLIDSDEEVFFLELIQVMGIPENQVRSVLIQLRSTL